MNLTPLPPLCLQRGGVGILGSADWLPFSEFRTDVFIGGGRG
jgi:hypothetical protein